MWQPQNHFSGVAAGAGHANTPDAAPPGSRTNATSLEVAQAAVVAYLDGHPPIGGIGPVQTQSRS